MLATVYELHKKAVDVPCGEKFLEQYRYNPPTHVADYGKGEELVMEEDNYSTVKLPVRKFEKTNCVYDYENGQDIETRITKYIVFPPEIEEYIDAICYERALEVKDVYQKELDTKENTIKNYEELYKTYRESYKMYRNFSERQTNKLCSSLGFNFLLGAMLIVSLCINIF